MCCKIGVYVNAYTVRCAKMLHVLCTAASNMAAGQGRSTIQQCCTHHSNSTHISGQHRVRSANKRHTICANQLLLVRSLYCSEYFYLNFLFWALLRFCCKEVG